MPAKKDSKEEEKIDYGSKLDKIIGDLGLDLDDATDNGTAVGQKVEPSIDIKTGKLDDIIKKIDLPDDKPEEIDESYLEEEEEIKEEEPVIDPITTPIYLNWKAYKRIVGYGMRYANSKTDMKKWREVYGILIGEVEENTLVVIKDAIPVCVGGKTGVELEPIHYVDLSQIDASVYSRAIENSKTDFIVGWWHTHPGFGFFYSEVDSYTHLGYQIPNPFAVGLVFDHTERRPNEFLGVASIRLTDPDDGFLSDYRICELHYDQEVDEIETKINNVVEKIDKNMDKVLKELAYIENTIRKKALAQLQRNYGLILVPKREMKLTEDEEEAEFSKDKLYVWDPDFFKKSYRIPKYREKVEKELEKKEKELKGLLESKDEKKYNTLKEKYSKRMTGLLGKANEWYSRLIDDFGKRLEIIFPFYDYLDTDERKIIEYCEERLDQYYEVLSNLNKRAKF